MNRYRTDRLKSEFGQDDPGIDEHHLTQSTFFRVVVMVVVLVVFGCAVFGCAMIGYAVMTDQPEVEPESQRQPRAAGEQNTYMLERLSSKTHFVRTPACW